MRTKRIEIVFDPLYNKLYSYWERESDSSIEKQWSFCEVVIDNSCYSHCSVDYPFVPEVINSSRDFDIINTEVYKLLGNSICNAGRMVSSFIVNYNNLLEDRIKWRKNGFENGELSSDDLNRKNDEDRSMMIDIKKDYHETFISITKELNDKYYPPIIIDKQYKFLIMIEEPNQIRNDLNEFNQKYNTNFEMLELTEIDGFCFSVIQFAKGCIQDLFYLGFHLAYKDYLAKQERTFGIDLRD